MLRDMKCLEHVGGDWVQVLCNDNMHAGMLLQSPPPTARAPAKWPAVPDDAN